jgi:3-hydroxyisobutyrate dehydrogenase-like beta-hydroxyacid dehydrogenase
MEIRVGLVGLGLMGRPIAANILKAGFPLTVWNRTASRMDPLVDRGARRARNARDAAENADVLITIVSDPPALEEVLWGEEGAIGGLRQGSVLVDSSTVSPDLARRIGAACAKRGSEFLDCPVTGGTWGAEKGELVLMVGGAPETLARAEPVLATFSKRWFHLGPHGAGQTAKLAMNLLLALEVEAFAESLALATAGGIAPQQLFEVMQSSMGRAPVLDVKAPMLLKREYTPSFPLRLMHKDICLALKLADELKVSLPSGTAAREVYSTVLQATRDDVDFAAIGRYWQESARPKD